MKKLLFVLLFLPRILFADAVIFSGADVKALKQNLDLFGVVKVMSGSADPTAAGGVAAPIGSAYLRTNGSLYIKTAVGNTAWTKNALLPVSLTADVTGILPTANGGTGSSNLGTGVVKASAGTLTSSTIVDADVSATANISATKLVTGVVSNTEFNYLDGVTSPIQTQIDSKVTGPASATDTAIPRYNGTTGKLVQNSGVTIDGSNNVSGVVNQNISGDITLTGTQFNSIQAGHKLAHFHSTGVSKGGFLSINTNPAKFDMTQAYLSFSDSSADSDNPVIKTVTCPALTAQTITNLATSDITYVLLDNTCTVIQQTTYPTAAQQRQYAFIGRLSHVNHTSLAAVINAQNFVVAPTSQLYDLFDAIGPFNVSGNIITPNGANLSINKSSGVIFRRSANVANSTQDPHNLPLSGVTTINLYRTTQTIFGSSLNTTIDPANYDVGGTVTAIPGANATSTNQRVFLLASNRLSVQYGQTTYNSLANAIAGIAKETFVINPNVSQIGILVGVISCTKNATDLSNSAQCVITRVGKFDTSGASAGSYATTNLQQAYNNSVTPQITTTTALGSLDIQRGSAADTDYVMRVLNGAGSLTAGFTGNGNLTASGVVSTGVTGTGKVVFDTAPTISGHPTIEGVTSTGATGTGKFVFDTSPTIGGTLSASTISASGSITGANLSGTNTGDLLTKSDTDGSGVTTTQLNAPNSQLSTISGSTRRLETNSTNLLADPSFEKSSLTDWSCSLGTKTIDTTNKTDGAQSLKIVSSGAGVRCTQTVTTNAASLKGLQMVARLAVNTTDTAGQVCALVDGTDTNCATVPFTTTANPFAVIEVPFVGGSTSNGIVYKSATTTTQPTYLDEAFTGRAQIFQTVNGAQLMGTVTVTGCSAAWSNTSTSLSSFGTQTGCTYTATGQALAPSTNLPAFKFASLPAGDYRIEYEGALILPTASNSAYFQFSDGTNSARELSQINSGSANASGTGLSQSISYATTQTNVTLELKGRVNAGGTATVFGQTSNPGVFKLWYFPPPSRIYSTLCQDPRQCETIFSAVVTSSGSITQQSAGNSAYNWLSGCTNASPSVCSFVSGVFVNAAPACVAITDNAGSNVQGIQLTNVSTSGISARVTNMSTGVAFQGNFVIHCQKNALDYDNSYKRYIVGTFQNVPTVSGISSPKLFGAQVTTTSGAVANNKGAVITTCTAANPTVCSFSGLNNTPICSLGMGPDSGNNHAHIRSISNTSISVETLAAATGAGAGSLPFQLNCFGD